MDNKQRLEAEEDKRGKENIADLSSGRKKNVFVRFDLKESREGFCRRGRGKPLHAEGPKTGEREKSAGSDSDSAPTVGNLR